MNEEEKEAIKTIKSFKNMKWYNHAFDKGVEILTEEERREIDIVINLIEKQQKEIEKLKDEYKREVFEHQEFVEDTKVAVQDYIKKDEIKEKIKELESHIWRDGYITKFDRYAIHYLNELLGG